MPDFESFSRSMLPLRSQPHVTVQRRGSMSLNRPAYESLGSPVAVELLFDRQAVMIGLRASPARADNAYFVRGSADGPWLISAMAFLKFYAIDHASTRRWRAYLDEGILCVDLTGEPAPGKAASPG